MTLIKSFEIKNRLGLHARAAARLATVAKRFRSDILLEREGIQVSSKSLLSILTLACQMGSHITLTVDGIDEKEALDALEKLIEDKFCED